MQIFKTKRSKAIAGGIGGVGIFGGGVAVAAILLTTSIGGTATVKEVNTSNSLAVTASAANGSALDCKNVAVSSDNKTLTLNPVLSKPVGGSNSSNVPVPGGECTITLSVKNTGDTTLKVDGSSQITAFPKGWSVSDFTGDALSPIAPGTTAKLSAKLTATQAAEGGSFGGKIVYTDAS